MALEAKKTKAPAKPRKSAGKKTAAVEEIKTAPSAAEIAELARKYWAERGWQDGYAEQDWLRAEQELQGMAS